MIEKQVGASRSSRHTSYPNQQK